MMSLFSSSIMSFYFLYTSSIARSLKCRTWHLGGAALELKGDAWQNWGWRLWEKVQPSGTWGAQKVGPCLVPMYHLLSYQEMTQHKQYRESLKENASYYSCLILNDSSHHLKNGWHLQMRLVDVVRWREFQKQRSSLLTWIFPLILIAFLHLPWRQTSGIITVQVHIQAGKSTWGGCRAGLVSVWSWKRGMVRRGLGTR